MALVQIDVGSSGTAAQTYRATKVAEAGGALAAGTICRITWNDSAEATFRRNTAELAAALEIATRRVLQLETD